MVTLAGIAFSFVPPEDAVSVWRFEAKLVGSCAATIAAARWLYRRAGSERKDSRNLAGEGAERETGAG
jgi:hypothetical protein